MYHLYVYINPFLYVIYIYINNLYFVCLYLYTKYLFIFIYKQFIYIKHFSPCIYVKMGFPGGSVVKNLSACGNHRRLMFCPWVRKIPWRRAWQPTPVFLPGECHRQRAWQVTVNGVTNSQTQLNDRTCK